MPDGVLRNMGSYLAGLHPLLAIRLLGLGYLVMVVITYVGHLLALILLIYTKSLAYARG